MKQEAVYTGKGEMNSYALLLVIWIYYNFVQLLF